MHRRDIIRSLFFGALTAKTIVTSAAKDMHQLEEEGDSAIQFSSKWHLLPDMPWTGEDIWAQRLQDFCIKNGELNCMTHGIDRTIHLLTHQLSGEAKSFTAEMQFRFLNQPAIEETKDDFAGFRLGIKGRYEDYRSAIMTGKGIDAGVTRDGNLFIGKTIADRKIPEKILTEKIRLVISVTAQATGIQFAKLKALDKSGNTIVTVSTDIYTLNDWKGNIALVSHFKSVRKNTDQPTIAVSKLLVKGDKLDYQPQQIFGPIYFAQYTINKNVLKLSAQLAPMDISGAVAQLYIKNNNRWEKIGSSTIHPMARIANYRIENWDSSKTFAYKVVYLLTLKNGRKKEYTYEGSVAAEPLQKEKVKALGFSCNWDYGFPDNEVVKNAGKHKADMVFFLGDQFYEPNGAFGVQMTPLDKACLDYLRKWYMFGWSYRDLFRHIPMAALPDDHDMYHGNIWGSGGRATVPLFGGAKSQDSGGYKMLPEWVNMAQLTQTSHMPDPFDPTPVLQHINVYYTNWDYGGISFGIVEDRKFKSAPNTILPEEAKVYNGFATNLSYDHSKVKNAEAQLLGERQMNFLSQWNNQWNKDVQFKVLVSATPFCCLQTLPVGTENDNVTPELPIPEKGVYVKGDAPTRDMDSNGWPHNRRDEVLKLLRKNYTLHLVGDQHMPAVVQYGTDNYQDSGFCFTVPALGNIWPRRWWPDVDTSHKPLPGKPAYTGNFKDGFGNKITVHAAVSPHKTGMQPSLLYDRVTGYGVVEFNKEKEEITMNCWPRYIDPEKEPEKQYEGWPITIHRLDNHQKKS